MTLVILAIAIVAIGIAIIWGFRQDRSKFLEHFAPAIITGFFLIGILPIANDMYWRRQKDYEICVQDRERRYGLIGSTAKTFTSIFKTHTRLYELAAEVSEQEKVLLHQASVKVKSNTIKEVHFERLKELNALKSDLQKNLIQLQGQIGSDSALVARYLPGTANQYFNAAKQYDDRVSKSRNFLPNPSDPLVKQVNELIQLMAMEAQRNENTCG
jgi:hypothetical protein